MMLFRSEDDVAEWCEENGREAGGVVSLEALQHLGQAWYGDRLDAAWRPRTRERSQAILDAAGLTGPFWQL